jgi:ABC-2 type transport system permease protein
MTHTALVMQAAINNSLRMRSVVVVSAGVVFICVVGMTALLSTQTIRPELNTATPDRSALESYLSLIMYSSSFVSIGVYASVIAFQSMIREKSRGNIQALLATPLTPGNIWLGKSLAVFLPGLVFASIMTLAAFLSINFIYFMPYTGFVVTPWMIISNFVAVPLIYLAMTLLLHAVGLTGKPGTGNVVAQIFLPVMIALMINLAVRDVLNAASWLFAVFLLSVAAVIGVIVLIVRPGLTAERIILYR